MNGTLTQQLSPDQSPHGDHHIIPADPALRPWSEPVPSRGQGAMPSRAASRAAAVRDETPTLARTAETWWWTVRSEMNSCREISRSGRPSAIAAQDLLFAGGEPGRGGPGGGAGPAGDRGHAELFHPPPGRGGGRAGPEVVQNGEGCLEFGIVRRGNDPRQGSVVGPAEPLPGGGAALPVAGDLQRIRFRQAPAGPPPRRAATARSPATRASTDRLGRVPARKPPVPPGRRDPPAPTPKAVPPAPPGPARPIPARRSPRPGPPRSPAAPRSQVRRGGRGSCRGSAAGRADSRLRHPGWRAPHCRDPRPRPSARAAARYPLGRHACSACASAARAVRRRPCPRGNSAGPLPAAAR